MKVWRRKSLIVWFTLAGMALGYLCIHPFATLSYILGPHPHTPLDVNLWGYKVQLGFSFVMYAVAGAFALMGGLAGFSLGAWHLQKERLAAAKLESQSRQAALDTLQELMVTLAHYIRNANMVIGGFSARLLKRLSEAELQEQMRRIQQASREIEAVITSLQHLTEINTIPYTAEGRARMIDLKQGLEDHLAALSLVEEDHGP